MHVESLRTHKAFVKSPTIGGNQRVRCECICSVHAVVREHNKTYAKCCISCCFANNLNAVLHVCKNLRILENMNLCLHIPGRQLGQDMTPHSFTAPKLYIDFETSNLVSKKSITKFKISTLKYSRLTQNFIVLKALTNSSKVLEQNLQTIRTYFHKRNCSVGSRREETIPYSGIISQRSQQRLFSCIVPLIWPVGWVCWLL